MQELLTDVKAGAGRRPEPGQDRSRSASYWFYHSQLYREAKYVVISHGRLSRLAGARHSTCGQEPGTTATLLNGIAARS